MCASMASAVSRRFGYTSRKRTPLGVNSSYRRLISGAYRFETGQSVLTKIKTVEGVDE